MDTIIAVAGVVLAAFALIIAYLQLRQARSRNEVPEPSRAHPDMSQYLTFLVNSYASLDFKGIVRLERLSVRFPLEDVYVEPCLRQVASLAASTEQDVRVAGHEFRADDLAEALGERMAQREETPTALDEVLATNKGVVILGEPGSGKSTALKALALRVARTHMEGSESRLPMVLPVAAYAEHLRASGPNIGVADFMSLYLTSVRGLPMEIDHEFKLALEEGRALVLLDGLDEVINQDERLYVVSRVNDFLTWNLPKGNSFLITSRIVGYADAPLVHPEVAHFMLLDFSDTEIDAFLEKWTLAIETAVNGESDVTRKAAHQERSRLSRAVFANPGVRRLAANPLLLTILVLIHRQGMELPRRRVELYEIYVGTLVNSWARARNLDGIPIKSMDELEVVKLLAPVAFWMHSTKPAGVARRDELVERAAEYYERRRKYGPDAAEVVARETIASLLQYSGLLTERGEGRFGFTHLSFQEFLAARDMVLAGQVDRDKTIELMVGRIHDPEWAEVIQLGVGYVGVVAKEEEAAALLVRALMREAETSDSLRALLLAAECVADCGVEGVGTECWREARELILKRFEAANAQPGGRRELGAVLDALGDPRFEDAGPLLATVESGAVTLGTVPSEVRDLLEEIDRVDLPDDSEWVRSYWRITVEAEAPQHTVELRPFEIGRFPVTNLEYARFVAAASHSIPLGGTERAAAFRWDPVDRQFPSRRGNHPVVLVSWDDARAYCEWLSHETGDVYRLPTEAEWEMAARGQTAQRYPWGDRWDPRRANTLDEGPGDTAPVGCYPEGRSPWGAEDCIGQVWEWTLTAWGDDWASPSFVYPYEPDARDAGEAPWKVVRGGSWDDVGAFARCAARGPNLREFKSHYIGFRIVREI